MSSTLKIPPLYGSCRLVVALMGFGFMFHNFFFRYTFSIALVCMVGTKLNATEGEFAIEGEFDWSRDQQSYLLGAFFYGYVATMLPGGIVSQYFHPKPVMVLGLAVLGLQTLAIPIMARMSFWLFFLARLMQGAISGVSFPSFFVLITHWSSPEEKATMSAIALSAAVALATILSFPVGSGLCYTGVDGGWPLIFYGPGATCIALAVLFHFLVTKEVESNPRISQAEKDYLVNHSCKNFAAAARGQGQSSHNNNNNNGKEKKPPIPWIAILSSPAFHGLWVAHWTFTMGRYLMSLCLPMFVNEVFALGIIENGLICAIPSIGILMTSSTGKVHDCINRKRWMTTSTLRKLFNSIALLTFAACLAAIAAVVPEGGGGGIILMALITIGSSVGNLCTTGGFLVVHSDMSGPFTGIVFSMTNTLANSAGILAPLLVAKVAPNGTRSEWNNVFYITSAIHVAGALIFACFSSSELQPWAKVQNSKPKSEISSSGNKTG